MAVLQQLSQPVKRSPINVLPLLLPSNQTHPPPTLLLLPPGSRKSRLRIHIHRHAAPLSSPHQPRILRFQYRKVSLRLPIPDTIRGENEVHLFERSLVGFRVQGPDDEDGEGVDAAEDVECLFVESGEDCGEEEDLHHRSDLAWCRT